MPTRSVEDVAAGLRDLLGGPKANGKGGAAERAKANGGGPDQHQQHRVAQFLPGRACYVYDLEDDFGRGIPTTVYRSKAEYSQARFKYVLNLEEDAQIIERLSGVLGYVRKGRATSGRHRRVGSEKAAAPKESQAEAKREAPVVDEEEDIFADAGTDFDDTAREGREEDAPLAVVDDQGPPRSLAGAGAGASSSKYFADSSDPARPATGDGGKGAPSDPEGVTLTYRDLEEDDERRMREMRATSGSGLGGETQWHQIMSLKSDGGDRGGGHGGDGDAYGELYPGFDTAMYDDDEDEGGGKLTTTVGEDEAEGEGGGGSNPKKGSGRKAASGPSREAKAKAEYSKMRTLFKEKGFGNESAFEEAAAAEEEDPRAAEKKGKKKKNKAGHPTDPTFQPRQKRLRL